MFFAPAPEGFVKVNHVRLEKGQIVVKGDGDQIVLAAASASL
jgi:hypothetical protein